MESVLLTPKHPSTIALFENIRPQKHELLSLRTRFTLKEVRVKLCVCYRVERLEVCKRNCATRIIERVYGIIIAIIDPLIDFTNFCLRSFISRFICGCAMCVCTAEIPWRKTTLGSNSQFSHTPNCVRYMETNVALIVDTLRIRTIHHKQARNRFTHRVGEEVSDMKLFEWVGVSVLNKHLLSLPRIVMSPHISMLENVRNFF